MRSQPSQKKMDGTGGCIVGKNQLDTGKSVCFRYAELTKEERSESRSETTVGCKGSQCEEQWRGEEGKTGADGIISHYIQVSQKSQLTCIINLH